MNEISSSTLYKRRGDAYWVFGDCMAFTRNDSINVLVAPSATQASLNIYSRTNDSRVFEPRALVISEIQFNKYLSFLKGVDPLIKKSIEAQSPPPTFSEPFLRIHTGNEIINYVMQVLWRYLWQAPRVIILVNYLHDLQKVEAGVKSPCYTPAEILFIMSITKHFWKRSDEYVYEVCCAQGPLGEGTIEKLGCLSTLLTHPKKGESTSLNTMIFGEEYHKIAKKMQNNILTTEEKKLINSRTDITLKEKGVLTTLEQLRDHKALKAVLVDFQ
jgi:hypothetical protein